MHRFLSEHVLEASNDTGTLRINGLVRLVEVISNDPWMSFVAEVDSDRNDAVIIQVTLYNMYESMVDERDKFLGKVSTSYGTRYVYVRPA